MSSADLAARLDDTLKRERSAIVALDTAALAAFEQEKLTLLDELKRSLDGPSTASDARRLLAPIFVEAEINALLLKEAVGTLSSLLGITETGVYD